jgi:hypothetical protein
MASILVEKHPIPPYNILCDLLQGYIEMYKILGTYYILGTP